MQTPQHAVTRTGHVVLHEASHDTACVVTSQLIALDEEATVVAEELGLDDENFGELGPDHIHSAAL